MSSNGKQKKCPNEMRLSQFVTYLEWSGVLKPVFDLLWWSLIKQFVPLLQIFQIGRASCRERV